VLRAGPLRLRVLGPVAIIGHEAIIVREAVIRREAALEVSRAEGGEGGVGPPPGIRRRSIRRRGDAIRGHEARGARK